VVREPDSDPLRARVRGRAIASGDLARTELLRVAARRGPAPIEEARHLLRRTRLIALTPELLDAAGLLQPADLRSLDAIHVQCALLLGDELEALVTYDDRMHTAAQGAGLPVLRP
jgi:predicted nucleic acid-binding protein